VYTDLSSFEVSGIKSLGPVTERLDGEWISEVVDDRLCLRYSDDQAQYPTDCLVVTKGDKNALHQPLSDMSYAVQRLPKDFQQSLRKGSNALYFGSCRESNETWLPLIEKAYAKSHGDYQAIDGGVTGCVEPSFVLSSTDMKREGIEDLTGGVASYIRSENVLDKDKLWEELMQVNDKFLFGCGTRKGRDSDSADDEGFVRGHAYTVLAAHEIDAPKDDGKKKRKKDDEERRKKMITKDGKIRLLKLHNPWGNQEWNGPWSDGSKEWTAEVLNQLGHTFADDGTFFISYQDFLRFYPVIDRIRLFGDDWTINQQWVAVNVPWTVDYLDTSFKVTITKEGPVVLVLSQPDTRYFKGLTGRYKYSLHFRLYKDGEDTYLLRSMEQSGNMRSCNAEVELKPGTYELLLKITAERFDNKQTPDQILREYRDDRREKLLAIGKSFDLTHSKGKLRELEVAEEEKNRNKDKVRTRERMVKRREIRMAQRKREKAKTQRMRDEMNRKRDVKKAKKKEELEKRREKDRAKRKAAEDKRAAQVKQDEEERAERRRKRAEQKKNGDGKGKESSKRNADQVKPPRRRRSRAGVDDDDDDDDNDSLSTMQMSDETDVSDEDGSINQNIAANGALPGEDDEPTPSTIKPTPETTPTSSEADKQADPDSPKPDIPPPKPSEMIPPPKVIVFDQVTKPDSPEPAAKPSTEPAEDSKDEKPKHADHPPKSSEDPNLHSDPNLRGDPPFRVLPPPPPGMLPPGAFPGRYPPPGGFPPPRGPGHGPERMVMVDREGRMPPPHMMGRRGSTSSIGSDDIGISPVSSVCDDDFAWDSGIDGPVSGESGSEESSEDEMYINDPWQGRCVIGLRVCSLDENCEVSVVRGVQRRRGRGEIAMGRARSPA